MKKNTLILIISLSILLIIGLLLIGFILPHSRSYHQTFTKSTDLSNENIEDLYLNDKINSKKIVSKYGEISKPSQDNNQYNYYYLTKNIEIATNKNDSKIIRFCVDDEDLRTEKGVIIGDSKEKAISLYGKNYYTRIEQGVEIIGYVDKEKDCSIEFWLNEKGIFYISFDYNYIN